MKDLQARQQTLINLITRVGGRQNIQKWMDELLKIDVKLEILEIKEVSKMETFTIGQKIVHPTWGEGEVFALMGKLVSAKFPGVGTKLVHDTSKLAVVAATQVKPAKEVVATKPQTKKLEKAKNQLLALGVLEKSIMLENGVIQVIGADTQVVGNQTYYWDAKVFINNNGNVSINPNQIKNSQIKAYEDYKDLQGSKPCKSFEKWLQPQLQLANLPSLEVEVNKIDAPPARITVVEGLNFWSLRVTRSVRHVQELSAAISHELKGSDCQDKATMVFLEKDVLIPLGGRDFFTTKNKDIKGVTEKNGKIKMFIREESFAPILEKLKAAAAKCGDSFTVDLCYSR
jgi:hypothetical protein